LALTGLACPAWAAPAKLALSGMPVYETYPLLVMAEHGGLKDVCPQVEFTPWNNPDQMRALLAGGQADFAVMPSNVAVRLRANGLQVKLVLASMTPTLWMVSRDGKTARLEDLKGNRIALPFRGDMPEIILERIAAGLGMNARQDFRLRPVSTPMDGLQQLLIGRVDYAFLAEPVISAAMQRMEDDASGTATGRITRAVDMRKEWQRAFPQGPDMILGAVAAAPSVLGHPRVIERFCREYRKALGWCREHPLETGRLVERRFSYMPAQAVARSIKSMRFKVVPAGEVRQDLERFLKIIGGGAEEPDLEGLCWPEK
jgi:NitT/TauT family transport system substrate-binding protein